MREVAQMVLERRESGDDLAAQSESWHAVRDALFGVGHDAKNGAAQFAQCGSLGLVESRQVRIDLVR